MAHKSEFRRNEKLRNCLLFDKDHISKVHSPVGDWVLLIHKALNVWAQSIPVNPNPLYILKGNVFSEETAEMVRQFKEYYGLLNSKNKIDRIVGKKTVYWLDRELPAEPFDP